MRGNFEEKYSDDFSTIIGTYINAFYKNVPITYEEKAYAFPETIQKKLIYKMKNLKCLKKHTSLCICLTMKNIK